MGSQFDCFINRIDFGFPSVFNNLVIQKILAPVSVLSLFNHKKRAFEPLVIFWEGKKHKILKIGYHHKVREGTNLFHIFSILCETLFFRLKLDTESLLWTVEEISDGEVN